MSKHVPKNCTKVSNRNKNKKSSVPVKGYLHLGVMSKKEEKEWRKVFREIRKRKK